MKAIVQHRYGPPDVLGLEEVDRPAIGDDEVLVRVHAAGVTYPDGVFVRGIPHLVRLIAGLRRPKQPVRGAEVAGTVTEIGSEVADLRSGDEVFGWCARTGRVRGGGFAEYARCPGDMVVRKPASLTFVDAAALPTSGVTALQAVRDWARVQPGQKVLVNGASGGVGTFAVQIAKAIGAEVTAVCSAGNADLVRSLGADAVIDYATEDFTAEAQRYDVILDFPHYAQHSVRQLLTALTPDGALVPASNTRNRWIGGFARILPARLLARRVPQRICAPEMSPNAADLLALTDLVESGEVKPVIGRTYPLIEVPDAMRYFGQGHTRGKIVITV
jgi:NADPH:quinone reductase-like Zn-dependent oxidoreductase